MSLPSRIPCLGCGALVPDTAGPTHRYLGASPGCWAVFGQVLAREYGEYRYPFAHRLSVDAYAAQHPGTPSPQTIQSVAVHLISLYSILERGFDARLAIRAMDQATRHKVAYVWLDPPTSLGSITVVDLAGARDATEHERVARDWARSVWQAWSPHRAAILRWAAL